VRLPYTTLFRSFHQPAEADRLAPDQVLFPGEMFAVEVAAAAHVGDADVLHPIEGAARADRNVRQLAQRFLLGDDLLQGDVADGAAIRTAEPLGAVAAQRGN